MKMARMRSIVALGMGTGLSLWMMGCGGGSSSSTPPPTVTDYTLTVNSTGITSGVAITVSPTDTTGSGNGSTSFTRSYASGTTVTLTAAATSGADKLGAWTGCTSSSGATCTVTMTANTTVSASYVAPTDYTLTVNSTGITSGVAIAVSPSDTTGTGNGSTSFTRSYASGTTVTLTAPATSGSDVFGAWTGCTSTSTVTCTVTIGANTTVSASYAPPPLYTLTVNSTGVASGIAIAVSPADSTGAGNGSTSFTRSYASGTTVTLTAPATSGPDVFGAWTGCTSATTVTCTVTLGANTTVSASYALPQAYTLTVNSTGITSGVPITVSPADTTGALTGSTSFTLHYLSGATVTLTAPATSGKDQFGAWTGCTSATTTTCTVTIGANTTVSASYLPPTGTTLTVNSSGLITGIPIAVSPADNNGKTSGTTNFSLSYPSGTMVVLTAPATSGTNVFQSWTGCTSVSTVTCNVTMSANETVAVTYVPPAPSGPTSITITPAPATVTIGTTQQFVAKVAGNGTFNTAVNWSILVSGSASVSYGSITNTGLYESPYPAPPSVTIVATSVANSSITASVVVNLAPPTAGTPLALTVDQGTVTHPIDPYIYGWDGFQVAQSEVEAIDLPINRYGGDAATRYNWEINAYDSASDYWFQNNQGVFPFDSQVALNNATKTATLGIMPLIGWTSNSSIGCSYSVTKYGAQQKVNPSNTDCGNGIAADGVTPIYNDPDDMNQQIGVPWTTNWMTHLVGKWGQASAGGIAIYDLDNEPNWWDGVHMDAHGSQLAKVNITPTPPYVGPLTYDELSTKGIAYAAAIKAVDPTAKVSGPIIDSWQAYFFSKKDVENGWATGPCYCWNGADPDRLAHGNVPFIEYYLQQFAKNDAKVGTRTLDYVDIHGYFAASGAAFNPAGDTTLQQARLNSTRAFWDPTYTDPNFSDPASTTNPPALRAPQLIRMLQGWVANDYPGTKTSIDEYNWGGQEHINGALAQADILGIFGREGLNLGALWGTPDPVAQVPGLVAFEVYRNYDGNHSKFGDQAVTSTSANQAQLSVYGAIRSSDNALTIVVINKTYGPMPATITLPNLTPDGPAQSFLYSNANLAEIVPGAAVTLPVPTASVPTSITQTFPAASITLFVIPTK